MPSIVGIGKWTPPRPPYHPACACEHALRPSALQGYTPGDDLSIQVEVLDAFGARVAYDWPSPTQSDVLLCTFTSDDSDYAGLTGQLTVQVQMAANRTEPAFSALRLRLMPGRAHGTFLCRPNLSCC